MQTEEIFPTLSELIEACGDEFDCLKQIFQNPPQNRWQAFSTDPLIGCVDWLPDVAVAKLWLALHQTQ